MCLTGASVAFSRLPVRLQSFLRTYLLLGFLLELPVPSLCPLPIFPSLICEGSLYIVDTNILLQVVSLRLWFVFHFVCSIFVVYKYFLCILKCIHVCHYGSCFFPVLFRKFFPLQCHKQMFLYFFLKVSRFCSLLLVFNPPRINFLYDVRKGSNFMISS